MFESNNKIVDSYLDNQAVNSCVVSKRFINSRLIVLLFVTLFIMISFSANADGLFDFQMKLAKGGNAEAQYKVGEMYETGFGVEKDMAEARKWTTQAASQGNETANFKLLYWDVQKNGLKDGNKVKVDTLVKKAEDGNPQAQYFVGKMHAYGVGVKKDPDEAISWLNKAAFVGVLEAERELVIVRENQQRQALAATRRAEEKKQAQLKAKQEQARKEQAKQAKLEQQRKLKAQQEAKASADAKAVANKKKTNAAALEKAKQEEANKAKVLAQQQAAAKEAARQQEAQKQALLKKQAEEKKRKTQFESDPCSGKSARFLSTCR